MHSLRRLHNPLPPLQVLHAIYLARAILSHLPVWQGHSRAPASSPGRALVRFCFDAYPWPTICLILSTLQRLVWVVGSIGLHARAVSARLNVNNLCTSQEGATVVFLGRWIPCVSLEMKSGNETWPVQRRICEAETRNKARRRRVLGPVAQAACHSSSPAPALWYVLGLVGVYCSAHSTEYCRPHRSTSAAPWRSGSPGPNMDKPSTPSEYTAFIPTLP